MCVSLHLGTFGHTQGRTHDCRYTIFFCSAELNRDYITDLVGFSIRFRESSPLNDIDFDERYFVDVNEFKLYSQF